MEVGYCDNCSSKIAADAFSSGAATHADDGKIYCAKCAPLFKFTTTALQKILPPTTVTGNEVTGEFAPVKEHVLTEQGTTKFYFCETCGKRITDKQILDGLGRDKKLKGVYCKDCAVGVMTMEFSAISDADLKKSVIKSADHANQTKESPPESNPQHGSGAGMLPARHSEAQPSRSAFHPRSTPQNGIKAVAIAVAIAGVLALIGALVLTSSSRSRSVLNERRSSGLSKEVVKTHPAQPALVEIANPLPVDTRPTIVQEASKTDPDILAKQDYDDMIKHVGSLDSGDSVGRLVAVDAFLKEHGESTLAKSARVMRAAALEQLNKTHASSNDLADHSDHDSKPSRADVPEVKTVTPAAVPANKGREQFASILKELAPILRQNRLEAARKLLDARRQDAGFADAAEFIDKEQADLTEINALRQRALNVLRAKSGSTITLTMRGAQVTGTVVDNPGATDLALALRDGPEMSIKADQLVAQDVDAFAPNDTGGARAEDMRSRGLLFLAAGDTSRAENYFTMARDAGLGSAVEPYLERIADARLLEKESSATEAWKNVEILYKEGKWKSSQSAITNFVKTYSSTQYAKQKQNDLASMITEIEQKIAQSEGYYFDFKTPESFSRFKTLLTPMHMDLTDNNGPMELKYEAGKAVFLRTGGRDWGTLQLQSDIVKLGKNWDLQIKGNFHIGDNDLISKANKIAFIALRFPKSKDKAGPNPDDQPRLAMRIVASAGSGSFQADWNKSPFDKLTTLNGTGLVSDIFRNPKFKAPGRSEGIFSFKVSMRQDKIKMEANSVPVAEYQLPPEAVSRIVDSPLALYICAWSELRQIDFEEFHFTNVDNPQDRVQK